MLFIVQCLVVFFIIYLSVSINFYIGEFIDIVFYIVEIAGVLFENF